MVYVRSVLAGIGVIVLGAVMLPPMFALWAMTQYAEEGSGGIGAVSAGGSGLAFIAVLFSGGFWWQFRRARRCLSFMSRTPLQQLSCLSCYSSWPVGGTFARPSNITYLELTDLSTHTTQKLKPRTSKRNAVHLTLADRATSAVGNSMSSHAPPSILITSLPMGVLPRRASMRNPISAPDTTSGFTATNCGGRKGL